MKALMWTAPRQMEFQEQPVPEVQPDEVLVKVAFAGICGLEYFIGSAPGVPLAEAVNIPG